MIKIHFHGLLKRYGDVFSLDVANPAEAVKALCLQIPGLEATIKTGKWHVLRGALESQDDVDEESLTLGFGEQREMHLMPAIEGAGSGGGVLSVVTGAILIAVAIFVPGVGTAMSAALMAGGAGLMVGGILMMTMKPPSADMDTERTDDKASFLLGKPKNNSTQGVAIPRGYGRCLVGSIVVSTSLAAHAIGEPTDLSEVGSAMSRLLGK